jgi:formylglycine-generating enzyme required for sulfatase activity
VGKEAHPVVQITHADAIAYAQWLGRRLPTEAEWEYASRGGLEGASFSWGEESPNVGASKANTWQGRFPYNNMNEDGFVGSSPVGCFTANGLGLYDTTGNVWEWTDTAYGPDRKRDYGEEGYDPQQPGVTVKTLKGGSFLCSDNYCQRFRPAARQAQDTTLASSHIGFRTAADITAYLDL